MLREETKLEIYAAKGGINMVRWRCNGEGFRTQGIKGRKQQQVLFFSLCAVEKT